MNDLEKVKLIDYELERLWKIPVILRNSMIGVMASKKIKKLSKKREEIIDKL